MSDLAKNQQLARAYLERYKLNITGHYIGGEWKASSSGKTFNNSSPIDNQSMGRVAEGDATDIDAACLAAEKAFPGWRDTSGAERKKLLHKFADEIEKRAEEIALIESSDCGQPVRFMRQAAIRGAANFRFFADKATEARDGQTLLQPEHTNLTLRTPIGPVGIITPWNTPFMLATWKIAPALASGCTVVHKPAELSPLSATLLAEAAEAAGLPPGVWNMVNGLGEEAGKSLTEHPAVKAIAFVGETTTGSQIMAQAAPTLKRVHFELGGKNPVIVFDDADFDRALDAVLFMIYSLNGQRCTSSSRLLIQSGIKDQFMAALERRVKKLNVGHPLDPHTEVGPLIHTSHLDKVMRYMDVAREQGATIKVGGNRMAELGEGNYFQPTLFTDANSGMRVAQEEIFGPVLTALTFENEAEAIEIANDTDYGLAAYIWTNDHARAMRLSRAVDAGMLWINSENNRNLPSPFGGTKMSGIGRDGGDYSFEFYMETRNVCMAHGSHKIPALGT